MIIDLHTHSNRSDGTDTPRDLVLKAQESQIDVLAITDHDTTDGWVEAASASEEVGIRLVRGIELSTDNDGQGQHLLAYQPDAHHLGLATMLQELADSRRTRIPRMVENIRQTGAAIDLAQVTRIAGNASIGRPHIADALVESGVCPNTAATWEPYLLPTSPTYVARYKPDIEDAIRTVAAAGGVTVVAHPWGRKGHVTEERFAALKAAGLAGIEVDHQEHDEAARDALRSIAVNLDLVVTGSSDYHGTRKNRNDLGSNSTAEDQFERLLSLVSANPR